MVRSDTLYRWREPLVTRPWRIDLIGKEGSSRMGWRRYAIESGDPARHGTGVGHDAQRASAESLVATKRLARKRWPA